MSVTNTTTLITIGAVYRPPSGSDSELESGWEGVLENLPKHKIHLMGDLNIDLLKGSQKFETSFYSHNLIPTISEATHEKPDCTITD